MFIEETVETHLLDIIDQPKTASEQWTKITERYKPDEEATKAPTVKKLRELKGTHPWSPEGMDAHWAAFSRIMRDAKVCGVEYTPQKKAQLFVDTIPFNSPHFHRLDVHDQSFDELETLWYQLRASLRRSAEMTPLDSTTTAIAAKKSRPSKWNQARYRDTRTCHFCSQKGHIQRNCQSYKEARARFGGSQEKAAENAQNGQSSKVANASGSAYYFRDPPPTRDQLAAVSR